MKKIILPNALRREISMSYLLSALTALMILVIYSQWDNPIVGVYGQLALMVLIACSISITGIYCYDVWVKVKKYRGYFAGGKSIDLRKSRFDLRKNHSED
jgi:hypothetical protein